MAPTLHPATVHRSRRLQGTGGWLHHSSH